MAERYIPKAQALTEGAVKGNMKPGGGKAPLSNGPPAPAPSRNVKETQPWTDGRFKSPAEMPQNEMVGWDAHKGYEEKRILVEPKDGVCLPLYYRIKKMSDGEARRYFLGWVQIAYARYFSSTPKPAWTVWVLGYEPQRGFHCPAEADVVERLWVELKGIHPER